MLGKDDTLSEFAVGNVEDDVDSLLVARNAHLLGVQAALHVLLLKPEKVAEMTVPCEGTFSDC